MDNEGKSFEELEDELLDRMVSRGCSQVTITGNRYLCNSIINQMKSQGNQFYTKGGGNKVLENYLKTNGYNQYYENLRTVVNRLNDLMDGIWLEIHSSRGIKFNLTDKQKLIVSNYCKLCGLSGRADGTVRLKRYAIQLFFSKLNEIDCTDVKNISAENISKACVRIIDHNIWGEVRVFLRYLSDEWGL